MSAPPPGPRQAVWLQRMRVDLPGEAERRGWPIGLDHCFGRVFLDAVCGGPWRDVVAAPAWRHLSPERLEAAIALADDMMAGRVDVAALNRASLEARRSRGPSAGRRLEGAV